MTHICVCKLTIFGSDNGLSRGRRQAIIRTKAGILLIRQLRTNFSEILIGIQTFSFKKMQLKMSSAKWRPFCLGLNELTSAGVKQSYFLRFKFSLAAVFCMSWSFLLRLSAPSPKCCSSELSSNPAYFREPYWFSMGLPEISRVTWRVNRGESGLW